MAKSGWRVTVVEKNATAGGRAGQLVANGFTFDMGPSWYWMPDVFERYFNQFGQSVCDYYSLIRLDPSYRVFWPDGHTDLPASLDALKAVFETIEKGSAQKLEKYLKEATVKYRIGMQDLVYKPGQSLTEFVDWNMLKNVFRLDVFTSIKTHVAKHFESEKLRQIMEFPVLFLGALPKNTPALYSLMNYADIVGGTWYPEGGMYSIVKAMQQLAESLGVTFRFGEAAKEIVIESGQAKRLVTEKGEYAADAIISGADYRFTESALLPPAYRTYSDDYWDKRVLAPSCLLYYVGLNKKISGLLHHNLFFDVPFDEHAGQIYTRPQWPGEPLFYLNLPSKTDPACAPAGCENAMILIPVASGLADDTDELREHYFQKVVQRLEQHTGQSLAGAIVFKKTFSVSDFKAAYNAYKGNAYGLANTLLQTAVFKPSCRSKKVRNLFYTGQFTVPGPGVPPSLISGEVVSKKLIQSFKE